MLPIVEVTRLLHTNYNCVDTDTIVTWFNELFATKLTMQTTPGPSPGLPFGLRGSPVNRASFLYDHRGGRRASSVELVEWVEPKTYGVPYADPWEPGIQSISYTASDLDEIERKVATAGGAVVRRGGGWLLLHDPHGVRVEVLHAPGEPSEQRFVRIVAHDPAKSVAWWQMLGYRIADDLPVRGVDVYGQSDGRAIVTETLLVPADDPKSGVIITGWSGPAPDGPTYGSPHHHGLYRLAMAVDDVDQAYDALNAAGATAQPPYTFALPGTKLSDGLRILFLRDPDNILVELVHRPRRHFPSDSSS